MKTRYAGHGDPARRFMGRDVATACKELSCRSLSVLPETSTLNAYDMIVVGAGYAGAVCARRLAETVGFRVAVLERRDHIAGNAYDYYDEAGILVHMYGPHIYHTFNENVHNFLSRFTEWTDYQHKVLANVHGTFMPVPFNTRACCSLLAISAVRSSTTSSSTRSARM